jgi:hypothetical protein
MRCFSSGVRYHDSDTVPRNSSVAVAKNADPPC